MKRFAISTPEGQHLGFMVFLAEGMADEEHAHSGVCMLRLDEAAGQHCSRLAHYAEATLSWQYDGTGLQLRDEDGRVIGQVRGQFARLGQDTVVLADLNESV